MMATSIRTIHTLGIITAVLFGVGLLTMTSIAPFVSASPATTNQTGNQTGANMTTTAADGGGDQAAAKMHLDEAMKALQAGYTEGAKMHAQAAQDSL